MNRTLVVWNEVPEDTFFIPFDNISNDVAEKLRSWHLQYINGLETEPKIADEMCAFFYDEKMNFKFERSDKPIVGAVYDQILIMGFVL